MTATVEVQGGLDGCLATRAFFETVGTVLDLDVNFSFCAPVFAMSIINLT